ncbi:MAG: ImmA/IrrE family metallo-endopeptidase [Proteobacteria bacterium]|nr:ImmA/IrrE family metallo-endopeptidase [Pseudomonadota bacterium]
MNDQISVNQAVLRWARETSGVSLQDVAKKLNKDIETIEQWENGEGSPTYTQLEKLAYEMYKRPLALFFFPEPPEEEDIKKSFRTLPESELQAIPPRVHYLLRLAKVMQINLKELYDERTPAINPIIKATPFDKSNLAQTAQNIRKQLGISIEEQKSWKNETIALDHWRTALEKHGVFVFKESFKASGRGMPDSPYSGFCLYDKVFPIVYVNNNMPHTRQIFTLFHELAHLLFEVSGIDKRNDGDYIKLLSGTDKQIEILCNKFAAEFLIPTNDINLRLQSVDVYSDSALYNLASEYCVSREVILRRAIDIALINKTSYSEKVKEWREKANQKKSTSKSDGGNYYRTQKSYLGQTYIEKVFSHYYQKRITRGQVADYLNIKSKNISRFENLALGEKP